MYSCAVVMAVCLLIYLSSIRGITLAGTQKSNSSRRPTVLLWPLSFVHGTVKQVIKEGVGEAITVTLKHFL